MYVFRRPYDYATRVRIRSRVLFGPIGGVLRPALLMVDGQIVQYTDESPNSPLCLEANGSVQAYSDVSGKNPLVIDSGAIRVLGAGETLDH